MPSSTSSVPALTSRIAIATQEDQIGRLIALALRLSGYTPHLLSEQESALDTLLHEPYAAAIVDVQLAPVDGYTICQKVRAVTSTPIILLLMRDDTPRRIRAQQAGASALLFLPFEIDELLTCVRTALQSKAEASANDQCVATCRSEADDHE
jgi:DNA-binding response OmpR family regulator